MDANIEKEIILENSGVTKRDLNLLMESYKDMIAFNMKLMQKQSDTLDKINLLADIQKEVTNDIEGSVNVISANHKECFDHRNVLAELVRQNDAKETQEHFRQNLKMWGFVGFLGIMTISLISLLIKVWPTVNYVAQIIEKIE